MASLVTRNGKAGVSKTSKTSSRATANRMDSRRTIIYLIFGIAFALLATAAPQAQQFLDPSNNIEWHKFVRAPSSRIITPARIVANYTAGNVSNIDAFSSQRGNLILTRLIESDPVPTIVLDFGLNVAGQVHIEFAGSQTPPTSQGRPGLKLVFSETKSFLLDRSDFTRSDSAGRDTGGTDQIAVKPEPYTWVDELGCEDEQDRKVCSDGLHGFRYLKITLDSVERDHPLTTSFGVVSISNITLHFSPFLGTPDTFTGHFECSDTELTQWYYDAVYTNDLCIDTFHANDTEPRNAYSPTLDGKLVLHDGPKRDRDPYIGDIAIQGLTTYLTHFGSAEAAANVIADLADHQRDDGWIPPASISQYNLLLFDYPLWWIVTLYDYVMYTGNTTFLSTYYPVMAKALDKFYPAHTNSSSGLLQRPPDTPQGGWGDFAFLPRHGGAPTYYNALYVHALNKAGELAAFLRREDDKNRWFATTVRIRNNLLQRNWDGEAGAFWDGGECGEHLMCPVHSQDGNSLAILSGVTHNSFYGSQDASESALAYLDKHMRHPYGNALMDNGILNEEFSTRVYAFTSYFEIAARLSSMKEETIASGFDQLRRMYGWMAQGDPGTFWEGIGKDGSPYEGGFTSMSHGWSTGIVPLMVQNVLGIRPTSPGFESWEMKPVTAGGNLTWARGEFATPYGAIGADWSKVAGGNVTTFTIDAPEGTTGVVKLFVVSGEDTITVDGNVAFSRSEGALMAGVVVAEGYVSIPLSGGLHHLSSGRGG